MKNLSEDADASANWSKWLTPLVYARTILLAFIFLDGQVL